MAREYIELPEMEHNGRLYHNGHMEMIEALIPNPCPFCHAADLLELPDGDLLCCFFAGGKGEGYADVNVYLSRLPAGESCWTQPIQVSDDALRSEQNPSLFLHPDGEIWLIYTAHISKTADLVLPPHANLQFTSEIRRKRSADGGKTWGKADTMFSHPGSFCRQKIQVLSSGRFLFSNWWCFDDDTRNGSDITVIQLSDDRGKTWRAVEVPGSRGCVHCNIVERSNGKLVAFFRSRCADWIYRSVSEDNGEHWTAPVPTELPNNNAGISAIALQNNSIALAYNACSFGEDRSSTKWPRQRSPITVALSEDDGVTWNYRRIAEGAEGYCGKFNASCNQRYEYPVLLQNQAGDIHLAYTWGNRRSIKYVRIHENWIRGEQKLDEGMRYRF